jgi:hypothetical protein
MMSRRKSDCEIKIPGDHFIDVRNIFAQWNIEKNNKVRELEQKIRPTDKLCVVPNGPYNYADFDENENPINMDKFYITIGEDYNTFSDLLMLAMLQLKKVKLVDGASIHQDMIECGQNVIFNGLFYKINDIWYYSTD